VKDLLQERLGLGLLRLLRLLVQDGLRRIVVELVTKAGQVVDKLRLCKLRQRLGDAVRVGWPCPVFWFGIE